MNEIITLRHLAFVRDLSPWASQETLGVYRSEIWSISKFFARRNTNCIRVNGIVYIIMLQDGLDYTFINAMDGICRLILRFRKLAVDNIGFVLVSIKEEKSNG